MTKQEIFELTRRPSRMEKNNIRSAYEAFDHFFSFFTLEDCRNHLWELYERCVMCYSAEKTVQDEASVILFFYTSAEMLMEAAWLINNKRIRGKHKIKRRNVKDL